MTILKELYIGESESNNPFCKSKQKLNSEYSMRERDREREKREQGWVYHICMYACICPRDYRKRWVKLRRGYA